MFFWRLHWACVGRWGGGGGSFPSGGETVWVGTLSGRPPELWPATFTPQQQENLHLLLTGLLENFYLKFLFNFILFFKKAPPRAHSLVWSILRFRLAQPEHLERGFDFDPAPVAVRCSRETSGSKDREERLRLCGKAVLLLCFSYEGLWFLVWLFWELFKRKETDKSCSFCLLFISKKKRNYVNNKS